MHVPLTNKHVMYRPRANMGDPPLIAVKPDRSLDPASPVQRITACLGTELAHQRLPRALAQPTQHPPAATGNSDPNQRIRHCLEINCRRLRQVTADG